MHIFGEDTNKPTKKQSLRALIFFKQPKFFKNSSVISIAPLIQSIQQNKGRPIFRVVPALLFTGLHALLSSLQSSIFCHFLANPILVKLSH